MDTAYKFVWPLTEVLDNITTYLHKYVLREYKL